MPKEGMGGERRDGRGRHHGDPVRSPGGATGAHGPVTSHERGRGPSAATRLSGKGPETQWVDGPQCALAAVRAASALARSRCNRCESSQRVDASVKRVEEVVILFFKVFHEVVSGLSKIGCPAIDAP